MNLEYRKFIEPEPVASSSTEASFVDMQSELTPIAPTAVSALDNQPAWYDLSAAAREAPATPPRMSAREMKDSDLCEPFYASNDYWHPSTARDLTERLRLMPADPDSSAALVIGAGTLPFTFDVLPSTIVVADLHESVITSVIKRCDFVATSGKSWKDYLNINEGSAEAGVITNEFENMRRAGLVRDFEHVQSAAQKATLIPIVGSVITRATEVADAVRQSGKQFTFVNFTNIAQYLPPRERGALALLVSQLPVHKDAVICDSSSAQQTALFTPAEYMRR